MCSLKVHTEYGTIEGTIDQGTCVWRGVPYAQPPVGALRFRPAKPPRPWTGVRDATRFGPACVQDGNNKWDMDEDCLYLNIWSPDADGARRPVLFFIHGGSFAGGCGSEEAYCGASFAQAGDVVVVTINYRVGALGFLDFSFLDENLVPNCGLHDVLQALRWVAGNIDRFGGDPENVTVFGQSAGGTITATLPTLPAAKGLFAKCIVMSGGPTLLQGQEEAQHTAQQFLTFLHIDTAEQLRRMDARQLTGSQSAFCSFCGLGAGTFRIGIDGGLVPDYPIPSVVGGDVARVPILIGTTREEMSFMLVKPVAKALDIDGIMNAGVSHENEENKKRIPAAYEKHYGRRRGQSMMYTDMVFRMGSVWFAEAYSTLADIWMYRFDYETAAMKVSGLHCFHSSDIPFVFGNFRKGMGKLIFLLTPSLRKAMAVSREMQTDFLTFARTGKLPWEKCSGRHAPAKCYHTSCSVQHMVEPEIRDAYEDTHFRRTSFESCKGCK